MTQARWRTSMSGLLRKSSVFFHRWCFSHILLCLYTHRMTAISQSLSELMIWNIWSINRLLTHYTRGANDKVTLLETKLIFTCAAAWLMTFPWSAELTLTWTKTGTRLSLLAKVYQIVKETTVYRTFSCRRSTPAATVSDKDRFD